MQWAGFALTKADRISRLGTWGYEDHHLDSGMRDGGDSQLQWLSESPAPYLLCGW